MYQKIKNLDHTLQKEFSENQNTVQLVIEDNHCARWLKSTSALSKHHKNHQKTTKTSQEPPKHHQNSQNKPSWTQIGLIHPSGRSPPLTVVPANESFHKIILNTPHQSKQDQKIKKVKVFAHKTGICPAP